MRLLLAFVLGAGAVVLLGAAVSTSPSQDPEAMKEMMAKAAKFTKPGAHHKELERFLGKWRSKTSFVMGGQKQPAGEAVNTATWLMDGRWLAIDGIGKFMGNDSHNFLLLGYDNFKQSFVMTTVSSVDTAMNHAEGDMTPDGKALVLYGTLDEYLTGEHDKMVKYVYRFVSDDEIVLEIHDLPIGLEHTQVVEVRLQKID